MFDLSFDGPVARLVLNRPEARNAIPPGGWAALADLAAQAGEKARMLILGGVPGGVFCAGADVAGFDAFREDPEARTGFRLAVRGALDTLAGLPIPTIALVEGACYGAGVALAMACDIRIAGPAALFAITPAKLGISYPQEDVHRLVSLVGPGQAARLLLGAQSIGADEAIRIGLAELPGDGLDALVAAILANDSASLIALKRGIRLGAAQDEAQDRAFDALLGSDALAERLARYRSRPRNLA